MARVRFLGTVLLAATLLAGCGGGDTGKPRSTEPNKPSDQQQKKGDEHKTQHEPG